MGCLIPVRHKGGVIRNAIVDADDFARLSAFKWYERNGYAFRSIYLGKVDGKSKFRTVYMHADVLSVADGNHVDHINFNRLDNRKENLRELAHRQNVLRRETHASAHSTRFRGVSFHRETNTGPRFIVHYCAKYLGVTRTPEEGAALYDLAALLDQGMIAQLNFPIQGQASGGGGVSAEL